MNTADRRNLLQISEKTTMKTISPNEKAIRGDRGFSLIELMIACFVLGIGVLSVTTMIGTSISRNLSSKNDTIAMAAAEQIMEELKATGLFGLTAGEARCRLTDGYC